MQARVASELAAARDALKAAPLTKSSIWSAADLREALASRGEEDTATADVQLEIARLERKEERLRAKLPDYVQKLVLGCTHSQELQPIGVAMRSAPFCSALFLAPCHAGRCSDESNARDPAWEDELRTYYFELIE